MKENLQASTSTKNKRKEKSSHQLFVNKSKKDDEVEVGDEKHEEEAGILEDFDYHDNTTPRVTRSISKTSVNS